MPDGSPCPPGDDGYITDNQFTTAPSRVDDGMPEQSAGPLWLRAHTMLPT